MSENCAMRVAEMDAGCPVCRDMFTMVMGIFSLETVLIGYTYTRLTAS